MAWLIEFAAKAEKELAQLDKQAQKNILHFLRERVADREDPRDFGGPLRGNLAGLWKYRVGGYRVIAEIQDDKVLIIVVRIGHRSKIYGGH